jgi:hypothetical protein
MELSQKQFSKIKKREDHNKYLHKCNDDDVDEYITNNKLEETLNINLDEIFKKQF